MGRTHLPKLLGDRKWRYLHVRPPIRLVAMPVKLLMMRATEWHRKLIAYLSSQRAGLRNLEMVRVARARLANEARLRSYEVEVRLAAFADGLR